MQAEPCYRPLKSLWKVVTATGRGLLSFTGPPHTMYTEVQSAWRHCNGCLWSMGMIAGMGCGSTHHPFNHAHGHMLAAATQCHWRSPGGNSLRGISILFKGLIRAFKRE